MSGPIRFVVRGEPIAQPRAATVIRNGARLPVNNPRAHAVSTWKQRIVAAIEHQYAGGRQLVGPIGLTVLFLLPRPERLNSKPRSRVQLPAYEVWHTSKPDCDNLVKALKDAGKGLLWRDDCEVAEEIVRKGFHARGGAPLALVEIREIEDDALSRVVRGCWYADVLLLGVGGEAAA